MQSIVFYLFLLGILVGCVCVNGFSLTPVKNTLFASNSAWRSKLPDNAPISNFTTTYVQDFLRQCNYSGSGRAIGDVWVGQTFPTYYATNADPTSQVVLKSPPSASAQQKSNAVPIPNDAKPETCCDHSIVFYNSDSDSYWDFWLFSQNETGNYATTGGYIANVSSNPGFYENPHPNWGVAATYMPLMGGQLAIADANAGVFPYAIRLTLQDHASGIFVPPARRTDGNGNGPIPEGTRFRFPPSFNVSTISDRFARMLATAIRDYGLITTDTTSGMPVISAEDTAHYNITEPYSNSTNLWKNVWNGQGSPMVALRQIPWNLLEVVDPIWQPWSPRSQWYQTGGVTTPKPYVITASLAVYSEGGLSGWSDQSFSAVVDYKLNSTNEPTHVFNGTYSIGIKYGHYVGYGAGAWAINNWKNTFDLNIYNGIRMWVMAAAASTTLLQQQCLSKIQLYYYNTTTYSKTLVDGQVTMCSLFTYGMPTEWTEVVIPLTDLGWYPGVKFNSFWIQSQLEATGDSYLYVDEVSIVRIEDIPSSTTTTLPSVASSTTGATSSTTKSSTTAPPSATTTSASVTTALPATTSPSVTTASIATTAANSNTESSATTPVQVSFVVLVFVAVLQL